MKKALLICAIVLNTLVARSQSKDSTANLVLTPPPVSNNSGDIAPSFPGGEVALGKYLSGNPRYPSSAKAQNIQGKVLIKFVIEPDGSVSDPVIMRGLSKDIDAEAIRVMSNSPKWNPGIQNGKAVKVQYTMPISFTLTSQ